MINRFSAGPARAFTPAAQETRETEMTRCPRCQNEEVMASETTLPSRNTDGSARVAHEFFCPRCKLSEGAVEGEKDFDPMIDRWEGTKSGRA